MVSKFKCILSLFFVVALVAGLVYYNSGSSATTGSDFISEAKSRLSNRFYTRAIIAVNHNEYWPVGIWMFKNGNTSHALAISMSQDRLLTMQVLKKAASGKYQSIKTMKGPVKVMGHLMDLSSVTDASSLFPGAFVIAEPYKGWLAIHSDGQSTLMFKRVK